MTDGKSIMRVFKGKIGSPGIAVGLAYLVDRGKLRVPMRMVMPEMVLLEKKRFSDAIQLSRQQLQSALERDLSEDHRQILDAHLAWTVDQYMIDEVEKVIENDFINAEWATKKLFDGLNATLASEAKRTRIERSQLFDEVFRRIMSNLMGVQQDTLDTVPRNVILVAHSLSPADMAHFDRSRIIGMATDIGGPTSHASILARGMELPGVVGLEHIASEVQTGDLVIIDAIEGSVIVNPTLPVVDKFQQRLSLFEEQETRLLEIRDMPATTQDGKEIKIQANMEFFDEIEVMKRHGVKDIGLFRSEFIFLLKGGVATEDEQYEVYSKLLQSVGSNSVVTIRTLDLGSDKLVEELNPPLEANPAMGLRAIRFCLEREDVFKDQLRALLRASVFGKLRIMFPMISGLGELRKAKYVLDEVRQELELEEIDFADNIDVGIMIEVPSAAVLADVLAEEVDFFSIGTNDLIQYTLAVDRSNEHVSHMFKSTHSAILRLIKQTVEAAAAAGISVSMCGEMAGDVQMTMLLIGLGVSDFSTNPAQALHVKQLVRQIDSKSAVEFANKAIHMNVCGEMSRFIKEEMSERFPEIFEKFAWTI
jgi:phosphoenolpyruvate-protein phosphotransferase (PTS system enzyme I)